MMDYRTLLTKVPRPAAHPRTAPRVGVRALLNRLSRSDARRAVRRLALAANATGANTKRIAGDQGTRTAVLNLLK